MNYDLRTLPKLRDGLTYAYFEHCVVEQEGMSVAVFCEAERVQVPAAALGVLMLGPGASITHAAIKTLVDNGCLVMWTGEGFQRFYAQGLGETRKGGHLEHQARLWADERMHEEIVLRMYRMRFRKRLPPGLSLEQIRGLEGVRVRDAYASASAETGVEWSGRNYDRGNWANTDPINRALSTANSCLYAICHTAIVSGGYSPGLGFIHSGKALSFVYDIGDLYKVETTIPISFTVTAENPSNLESVIRAACREKFRQVDLLARILPDIDRIFDLEKPEVDYEWDIDADPAKPTPYWEPKTNTEENEW
jgi:CRISPR-associated protein Cas1